MDALQSPLVIAAVGDIMLGTDFPDDRLPPNDGAGMLSAMTPVLASADLTIGNLEGVIMNGGESEKECRDPSVCYVFRTPPHYVTHLQQAGFDVLSLANNHARDFGEEGRLQTMAALAAAGIRHSGQEGDIASWSVQGRRVAFIAFAPFIGANDFLDTERAQGMVAALAAEHDVVIVSMHAGAEGGDNMHVPFAFEYFHGENRGDVVKFAHAVIDAGADLVLGHGPHVPRAMELYRGRLVAYSLGNFSTYFGIKVSGVNGVAPVLVAQLGPDGEFLSGQIVSARQQRPAGPLPDPQQEAAQIIASLTRNDFPATPLRVDIDGSITVEQESLAQRSKPLSTP
ncbi:MAG: CapA family protein [Pseudomonadota bacterium]|nr:MAG: CapA family protein [Pseudomonadota bacterium]